MPKIKGHKLKIIQPMRMIKLIYFFCFKIMFYKYAIYFFILILDL